MTDSLVSLLVQIPLVGFFGLFVLEMIKRQSLHEHHRDDDWRTFLREQREQTSESMERMGERIGELTVAQHATAALLAQHDWSIGSMPCDVGI